MYLYLQAFSHFTFECSHHRLIVVDIQGVGDLYTDPQIHTYKYVIISVLSKSKHTLIEESGALHLV